MPRLRFVGEDQFAVVVSADDVMVRVVNVVGAPRHKSAQSTIAKLQLTRHTQW